jgi:hypothetical protein
MSIHHLPLAQVTAAVLEELRVNTVVESRMLDYKETLPGESDMDKRELLADVTAFANSAGGDLIYGVKERRKDGKATGEPAEVVGLPSVVLDQEQLRLDATLRTGMDPRIPGLMLHAVPRGADPPCLVIRVPRSPHGIHMVTYKGSSRFYARGTNGRYEMDWGQIRGGFLQAAEAHERVRRFREERVLRLLAGETPIAMGDSPKVIVHALPLNALDVWPVFQTLTAEQRMNGLRPMGGEPSDWRYNLDGFVLHTTRENPSHQTYVQCFRDGGLEAMSGRILDGDPQRGGFYGWSVEVNVLQAVTRWQQHVWPVLGMAGPVAFSLTLSGVKGWKVLPVNSDRFFGDHKETLDRDVVMLPELVVQDLATPVPAMLQPLFDLMWNCGGWAKSPSYVAPGKLRQS